VCSWYSGPDRGHQAGGVDLVEERAEVAVAGPVEAAAVGPLVHAPRHVRLDDADPERGQPVDRLAPQRARRAPVVQRGAIERDPPGTVVRAEH
jgi:hypothetical protein